MELPTILEIGLIFAFFSSILLFVSESFSYSKSKFFLSIDTDKARKIAFLFGLTFIICAMVYISSYLIE